MSALRNRLLCTVIASTLVLAVTAPVSEAAAEDGMQALVGKPRLRVHRIRSKTGKQTLQALREILAPGRALLFDDRGEIVVYADPKTQLEVAERISATQLQILERLPDSPASPRAAGTPPKQTPPPNVAEKSHVQKALEQALPSSSPRSFRLPRGPVKLVYLKELDLLLIRTGR